MLRELVSSSKMNEQIRDVHSNSFAYLATVTGSLPYLQGVRDVGILAAAVHREHSVVRMGARLRGRR